MKAKSQIFQKLLLAEGNAAEWCHIQIMLLKHISLHTMKCHVSAPVFTYILLLPGYQFHVFSIYRVPQVLVHYEVLKYSDELMELLKSGKQKQEPETSDSHFSHGLPTNQLLLYHLLQINFLRMEVKMKLKFVVVQFRPWSQLQMKLESY